MMHLTIIELIKQIEEKEIKCEAVPSFLSLFCYKFYVNYTGSGMF